MTAPRRAAPRRILALNSLDGRYGSTYRFRALTELLRAAGHQVTAREGVGSAVRRLADAMGVARLRGCPVLVDWDDLDPDLQGSRARRWLAAVCEAVGPRLATGITTHSDPIRCCAAAAGRPVHLVPQGYDGALFRPDPARRAAARAAFGYRPGDAVVGHLCTFTHGGTLDLPVILDAWRQIADPRVKFLLVGGGPQEAEVRAALDARGLGPRTRVTGLLPHAEVPDALRCLDVGVVYMRDCPANRARVSFKVIEYLALDIPVVGQVVGETADLFGAWVARATAVGLAAAIVDATRRAPTRSTAAAVAPYRWEEAGPALRAAVAELPGGPPCA